MNVVSDSDASWSTNRSSPPIEELWKSVDALSMEEYLRHSSSRNDSDILSKSGSFSSLNSEPLDSFSSKEWTQAKSDSYNISSLVIDSDMSRLYTATGFNGYQASSDLWSKFLVLIAKAQCINDSMLPLQGPYYSGIPMRRANSMPVVCNFFLQGYCARGNSCKYAHILNPEVMENSGRLPYFAEMQSNASLKHNNSLKVNRDVSKPRILECKFGWITSSPSFH